MHNGVCKVQLMYNRYKVHATSCWLLAGADLDLTVRGGIAVCEVHGENFGGMALLRAAQRTYVYDTELTK